MRVIRCPNCEEPLPGFANYCAICGETLIPSPTSTTARLSHRPRAFKVPRFFALRSESEETVPFGEVEPGDRKAGDRKGRHYISSEDWEILRSAQDDNAEPRFSGESTIPLAQEPTGARHLQWEILRSAQDDNRSVGRETFGRDQSGPYESLDAEDYRSSGNWHKVVARTSGLTNRAPTATPRTPRPLPSAYQLTPRPPRPPLTPRPLRPPGAINRAPTFWVSALLLVSVIIGSLLGVIVTIGHGALAQKSPHSSEISLQVTPSSVALGATIALRGSNFSPRGQVGLTRDTTIPITDTAGNTIVQADSKGTFTDTVNIGAEWQAGSHIIRAEDAQLHKTASFTILVTGHSASLRPARLLLSTNAIDLGSGDQATNSTKALTMTNAGGGQISWQSTATQAWLLLSPKSGTFSSGQSVQVTIAADRANSQPGSYSAQMIFTSNAGQIMLPVTMKTTPLEPGHEAVLQLTPPVLSFTGIDGGINPTAQVVTVSNPGVLPLQWEILRSAQDDNWLSVSPTSGNVIKGGSQAVVIRVNSSYLLPGIYAATVTFSGQGPDTVKDSPQNIYVSLTILPQCALQVSPGDLSFSGAYLQPGPPAKIVSLGVTQSCSMQLRWSATVVTNNGGQWLNIGPAGGLTPSYPSIGVNVSGLKPGVYTGSIIFSSAAGKLTLPVIFTMGQPTTPIMTTTPATMAFSVILGQPNAPGQTITITNAGGGTLKWQAAVSTNFGGAWLSALPAAGSLSSHQPASVNVTATALNGMTPNTYTGMVTITGTDGSGHGVPGSPQAIPVNFTVLAPCSIAGTPRALNFMGAVGQPNPATQPATITASGTCLHTLDWAASISNAPWLTATPASGTVNLIRSFVALRMTVPATSNIGVAVSGLSPNTYTGQVIFTATDSITHQNVGTPQTITVTLTVQPPCTLQAASVPTVNFSSEVGLNPNPDTQSFTIGIFGACSGNITITPTVTQSWLSISPTSAVITGGNTPFTAKVASASLGVGSFNDTISLAAVDSNGIAITGSPQTVGVVLSVLAAPALTVGPLPGGLNFNTNTGTTSQAIILNNTGGDPSTGLLCWLPTLPPMSLYRQKQARALQGEQIPQTT
ncbi:MAG TPA: hypothetical protein VK140_14070 [Ktedonobacteraceae bacterium]|nr:hypothetical protein [Ktedonobacteraceae bacterium]